MAGEGGHRPYWPTHLGVNLSNGNLCLMLGQASCVTCGSSEGGSAYPNPQSTTLNGPTLIYNTLGTADSDLGSKWMLPYHTYMTVAGNGDVTLIDADGTLRFFVKDAVVSPQTYTATKEDAALTSDGTNYYLKRFNGDIWQYGMSSKTLDQISSRTTHTITITRDGNGRITTVTDGQGRDTKYYYITYSAKTRLNEIRELAPGDVGFQSTFLQYDSSGRLVQITNPMGDTTRFTYDGSDRIDHAIDGHGHATIYTYTSNKVTNIEDPAGNSTVFGYSGSTTTVTDRRGNDTVYGFDGSARVSKITDALLNETEFSYDSTSWEVTTILGPKIPQSGTPWKRQRTNLAYNSGANRHELATRSVDSLDNTSASIALKSESWTYNALHDVLTHVDARGKTWTKTYKLDGGSNSVGLVLTAVNPLSQTTLTNTYDSSGNKFRLLTSTNGVSKTTTFDYNQNTANSYGTPDKITTDLGHITNLKVDVRGRTYEVTDPSGNTEQMEYDALDRLVRQIHPDGTSIVNKYDCCHLAASVDENGLGTGYEHDVMGRVAKVTDANGEETTYVYNEEGWQTDVTDPRGNTTTKDYDDVGRVLEIDFPGGWVETYTYWEPGMLKTYVATKGATNTSTAYEYNDLYQLTKKNFPSGTDTEYEWNAAGLVMKMKDTSGEKRYTYDDASRLTKVAQGPTGFVINTDHNYIWESSWNAASQRTQQKLTIRTQSALIWDYAYSDDGQLDTVTNPDSDVTDHDYLDDGRLKKITLATGSTREYFYQDTDSSHAYVADKNKHLRKTLDKKSGAAVICSFEYELDKAGNRLSVTDKDAKYTKYGIDVLYQLTNETKWSAKTPGTRTWQYNHKYDPNGNRTALHHDGVESDFTYGDNNELTAAPGASPTYDNFGNTVAYGSAALTYDFERHMTLISDGDPANDDTHEYDGNGRRMRSKFAGATDWSNFVHDEITEQIIAEYTLISSTFTITSVNTHGIGLISTSRSNVQRYFHFDGLGSTAALTDKTETVQDTYVLSAYGTQESSTGSSVNPYRFVGQWGYYDDGAMNSTFGLVLLGIRYYKPDWAMFLAWDPSPREPKYSYAHGRPGNYVDPSGFAPTCIGSFVTALHEGGVSNDDIRNLVECISNCKDIQCYANCLLRFGGKKFLPAVLAYACCVTYGKGGHDPCDPHWYDLDSCCRTKWCLCYYTFLSQGKGGTSEVHHEMIRLCEETIQHEEGCLGWQVSH